MLGAGNVQSFDHNGKVYQFISAPGTGKYTGKLLLSGMSYNPHKIVRQNPPLPYFYVGVVLFKD